MNDLLTSISRKSWKKKDIELDSLRSSGEGLSTTRSDIPSDIEKGIKGGIRPEEDLNAFFKKDERIRSEIRNLQRAIEELSNLNEEGKNLTIGNAIKAHERRMAEQMKGVRLIASSINRMLSDLMEDNRSSCQKPDCGKGTATYKTRQNVTEDLRKKLEQRVNDFQDLVDKINTEEREITKRRYTTITGETPDEKTINSLNTPEDRDRFLRVAVQSQGREDLAGFLEEMEERNQGVQGIIKDLLDLQSLFMDMSVMVESQGKLLETIDSQVNKANEYIAQGNQKLGEARGFQIGTRKWKLLLFLIILFVTIISIVVIVKLTSA